MRFSAISSLLELQEWITLEAADAQVIATFNADLDAFLTHYRKVFPNDTLSLFRVTLAGREKFGEHTVRALRLAITLPDDDQEVWILSVHEDRIVKTRRLGTMPSTRKQLMDHLPIQQAMAERRNATIH